MVARVAYALAFELRDTPINVLAVSPGFLRSEAVLSHFGVDEEHWKEAISQDEHFAASETPCYIGRAVVALACDGGNMDYKDNDMNYIYQDDGDGHEIGNGSDMGQERAYQH